MAIFHKESYCNIFIIKKVYRFANAEFPLHMFSIIKSHKNNNDPGTEKSTVITTFSKMAQ